MGLFFTVVTASNVQYSDLGDRIFVQGLTNYEITDEFSLDDLANSIELSSSIAAGEITLTNAAGTTVTDWNVINSNVTTTYDVNNDGNPDTANTASLAVTSSYAVLANTAETANTATTASYALTAEVVLGGIQNAISASYVEYNDVVNKPTLVSSSAQIDYTQIQNTPSGLLSGSAQIATEISGAFANDSASFSTRITTNETDISNLQTTSGSFSTRVTDLETASGSFSTRVTSNENNISSLTAATSSYVIKNGGNTNNQTIEGNITVTGDLTVENLYWTNVTSSVIYQSGSTKFGDTLDDTHQFTGSVSITGSQSIVGGDLTINGTAISSSLATTIANNTLDSASFSTRTTNLEIASGSFSTRVTTNETDISNLQTDSGSFSTRVTKLEATSSVQDNRLNSLESVTGSYATTGSNTFIGNQTISGSLLVTGSGITLVDGVYAGNGSQLTLVPLSWNWVAARNANVTSQFLRGIDGMFTNNTPYICPVNCELVAISVATDGVETWVAEIYKNGTLSDSLTISSVDNAFDAASYGTSYTAGDKVSMRANGSAINKPSITAWFRELP